MTSQDQVLHLDPALSARLDAVGKELQVAPGQLVETAVTEFLRRLYESQHEQRYLAAIAAALPSARKDDPGHRRAIAAIISAELSGAHQDPVEGELIAATTTPLQRSLEAALHG